MSLKKALQRQREFSARGSKCPICKRDFRHGCNHSVVEARTRLADDVLKEKMRKLLKEEQ